MGFGVLLPADEDDEMGLVHVTVTGSCRLVLHRPVDEPDGEQLRLQAQQHVHVCARNNSKAATEQARHRGSLLQQRHSLCATEPYALIERLQHLGFRHTGNLRIRGHTLWGFSCAGLRGENVKGLSVVILVALYLRLTQAVHKGSKRHLHTLLLLRTARTRDDLPHRRDLPHVAHATDHSGARNIHGNRARRERSAAVVDGGGGGSGAHDIGRRCCNARVRSAHVTCHMHVRAWVFTCNAAAAA